MWPFRKRPDRLIDTLIKTPRQLHVGFDEAIRDRAAKRRKQAAEIRSDAARFETRGDRQRFTVVK